MDVKNRFEWIDVLKGLGILAVVIGHLYGGFISKLMYLFHMPLFFFVGGYLFNIKNDKREFLLNKTFQLIVPYLTFLILLYVPQQLFYFSQNPFSFKEIFSSACRALLGGRWLGGSFTVFWFVTCFFTVQQLMNLLLNRVPTKNILLIMLLMLGLSYWNSSYFSDLKFPWNLNVVLHATPIFYIGYLFKEYKVKLNIFIVAILSFGAIYLLFINAHNTYNIKEAKYGIPLITLSSSIVIICLLIYISKAIVHVGLIYKPLARIGQASIVIMFLHQPVHIILTDYFTVENSVLKVLASIAFPLIFYFFAKRNVISSALFLGSNSKIFKLNNAIKFDTLVPVSNLPN